MHHCLCRPHETKTFSPLAELLPNHTLPELLFLETKWASLMSYGMTSKLLQDMLPIKEPINTFTIRQHIADVAERLEQELGHEQFCFVEGCQRSWDELPSPGGAIRLRIFHGSADRHKIIFHCVAVLEEDFIMRSAQSQSYLFHDRWQFGFLALHRSAPLFLAYYPVRHLHFAPGEL